MGRRRGRGGPLRAEGLQAVGEGHERGLVAHGGLKSKVEVIVLNQHRSNCSESRLVLNLVVALPLYRNPLQVVAHLLLGGYTNAA